MADRIGDAGAWRKAVPAAVRLAGVAAIGLAAVLSEGAAPAAARVSCGGAAMLGGAQLMCSQPDMKEPPQLCTFRWALTTAGNAGRIVEGSFLLPPGASNVQVYQGSGFDAQLTPPIVLCQGRKGRP